MSFFLEKVMGRLSPSERSRFLAAQTVVNRGLLSITTDKIAVLQRCGLAENVLHLARSKSERDHRAFLRNDKVVRFLELEKQYAQSVREAVGLSQVTWEHLADLDAHLQKSLTEKGYGVQPSAQIERALVSARTVSQSELLAMLEALILGQIRSAVASGDPAKLEPDRIAASVFEQVKEWCGKVPILVFESLNSFLSQHSVIEGNLKFYILLLASQERLTALRSLYETRRADLIRKKKAEEQAALKQEEERKAFEKQWDDHFVQVAKSTANYVIFTPTCIDGLYDKSRLAEVVRNLERAISSSVGFAYNGNDTGTIVMGYRDFATMDWRMLAVLKSYYIRDRAGEFNQQADYHRQNKTVFLKTQLKFVSALNADGRTPLDFKDGSRFGGGNDRITRQVALEHMELYTGNLSRLWLEVKELHERRSSVNATERLISEFVLKQP